jgi:putative hydrolase of the HAD superfamily/pyrimidine and pyridine-specific 5'-nucleotidase
MKSTPEDFMPDSLHALRLYFQFVEDQRVSRRLLRGYSSANVDAYDLRPKVQALFFDCDDCLYFDGWKVANKLTSKIDEWCVRHGLAPGQAYQLYKQYGTALRGLLAEGYLEATDAAIDGFLKEVHDVGVHDMLERDDELRSMLIRMNPSIPKFIFTASVAHHAEKCLQALGISDLFVSIIDCKQCEFESKHSEHSFRVAMRVAGIEIPESVIFFDDNVSNIAAARRIGWRSVLVGRVGRDCGQPITTEHAELEVDRIHDLPSVLPELFAYG